MARSFCKLVSTYYGFSLNFYQADDRFSEAIKPYLYLFNEKTLIFLLDKIEANNQTYYRGKSVEDHFLVYLRIKELFGDKFDFSSYPKFYKDEFMEQSIDTDF